MKQISQALQEHLGGTLTTLAECVKITRQDNVVIAFTTHDADLVIGGVTYKADGSYVRGALDETDSLKETSYDISGILDSQWLSESDIQAGLYDHAQIEVSVVNWAGLDQGCVTIRSGWLGEVARTGGKYTAALRGLHDLLERRVGDTYTPECRYDLGDERCRLNIQALTREGAVTQTLDSANFIDATRSEADGYFNYGKIVWTSGANQGLAIEARAWSQPAKQFTLWMPMPNQIAAGDRYTVCAGCDKRFSTCKAKFNNAANFGGFPHLPGLDKILQYPDSK